jgi:predicted ATPase
VGRTREMAEVKRLMGSTRLLTLTGPGGTGKTRLSLQVAAELLDQFPHGVWLVELSTISDPTLIPEAILNAIDIREEPDRPPLSTLTDALRTRNLLIVLDNCEHLIAPVAQIASILLRQCPKVKIIASSREPMNIEGETLWPVSALSAPDPPGHRTGRGPGQGHAVAADSRSARRPLPPPDQRESYGLASPADPRSVDRLEL